MKIVDTLSAEHYLWGNGCDGWHLLKRDDLSVIEAFESRIRGSLLTDGTMRSVRN